MRFKVTRTFSFVSSVTVLSIVAVETTHARSNQHLDDTHGACQGILATRRSKQCMRAMGRTGLSRAGQGGVGAERGPVGRFDDNLERILQLSRQRRADQVWDLLSGLRRCSRASGACFRFDRYVQLRRSSRHVTRVWNQAKRLWLSKKSGLSSEHRLTKPSD
jgi:hypothetical protein